MLYLEAPYLSPFQRLASWSWRQLCSTKTDPNVKAPERNDSVDGGPILQWPTGGWLKKKTTYDFAMGFYIPFVLFGIFSINNTKHLPAAILTSVTSENQENTDSVQKKKQQQHQQPTTNNHNNNNNNNNGETHSFQLIPGFVWIRMKPIKSPPPQSSLCQWVPSLFLALTPEPGDSNGDSDFWVARAAPRHMKKIVVALYSNHFNYQLLGLNHIQPKSNAKGLCESFVFQRDCWHNCRISSKLKMAALDSNQPIRIISLNLEGRMSEGIAYILGYTLHKIQYSYLSQRNLNTASNKNEQSRAI